MLRTHASSVWNALDALIIVLISWLAFVRLLNYNDLTEENTRKETTLEVRSVGSQSVPYHLADQPSIKTVICVLDLLSPYACELWN